MAIATKHLLEQGERVLVLDLDIHHGCGTEELLEEEKNAHIISLYQQGIWPGDKHYTFAANCTHLPIEGTVDDKRYLNILREQVLPEIDAWNPTRIGVSLGFDTFIGEQFGWNLTAETIRTIKKMLKERSTFAILEGGYTPSAVRAGIEALIE